MWFTLSAFGATWNIPGDYPTIAAAVASGSLTTGDELVLAAQAHEGADLTLLSTASVLTIRGVPGTVLTPQVGAVSVIDSGFIDLTIEDLEIDGMGLARGLLVRDDAIVTLEDVVVRNGSANDLGGGALVRYAGQLWVNGVSFIDGSANEGAGVATELGGSINGNGLTLSGGIANRGGGLYIDPLGSYQVPNATIEDNFADQDGGGVYTEGMVSMISSVIRNNTANGGHGAGIYTTQNASVDLFTTNLRNNLANNEGGGIAGDGLFTVQACLFEGNIAQKGGAGTLEGNNGGTHSFDDVAFCGNVSTNDDSHALRTRNNAQVLLRQTVFAFNGQGTGGNGDSVIRSNGPLTMEFGLFYGNQAEIGLESDDQLTMTGVVFDGSGLKTQGGMANNALTANAFAPGVTYDSQVDISTQLQLDPMVVDLGGCDPYDYFPYASNPALLDQVTAQLDDDGSLGDVGHLGGTGVGQGFWGADEDDDDAYVHVDCDDNDPDRYPGAVELCDGVDNDCDGSVDEEGGGTFYPDLDGDGYGDQSAAAQVGCPGPGLVTDNTDCDDTDSHVNPGQPQDATCDGNDDDCDGSIDEDAVVSSYYPDADGDGFGDDGAAPTDSCTPVVGAVTNNTDCDDSTHAISPDDPEQCDGIDNDCSGTADDGLPSITSYADVDGDGYGDLDVVSTGCDVPDGYVTDSTDCDDGASDINPDATEQCDPIDHDCDGDPSAGVATSDWWPDVDGDGFGDESAPSTSDCAAPTDHVSNDLDCDDGDPEISPNATEQCDATDWDCDGDPSNGIPQLSWYLDVDGDGYGTGVAVLDCAQPSNHVALDGDCDPADSLTHPDADEVCDGADNDCDTLVDDDDLVIDAPSWYPDLDADTYGDEEGATQACAAPSGFVGRAGDCDDAEPNINEGAAEACIDGLDNDCDGHVDADDPDYSFTGVEYGEDSDGDGYGSGVAIEVACSGEQTLGWVPMSNGEDCDDARNDVFPGALEICNGIDDDCDMAADEQLAFQDYFLDADGDTFGDPNAPTINACARPDDRVSNGLDCDDTDPDRHPFALEVCNDIDDNCNMLPDDGLPSESYFPDLDEDGYGDALAHPIEDCEPVEDHVLDNTDCDDADDTIHPGAVDAPEDGIDADCDGTVEEIPQPVIDTDGDGIPDDIDNDPLSAGDFGDGPAPPGKEYGCGCQTRGWLDLTGLLRR